jgi:hypothetical protein
VTADRRWFLKAAAAGALAAPASVLAQSPRASIRGFSKARLARN